MKKFNTLIVLIVTLAGIGALQAQETQSGSLIPELNKTNNGETSLTNAIEPIQQYYQQLG